MAVAHFDDKSAIPIFTNCVRLGSLHRDLVQYPPKTYTELMDRAARFAEAEVAEKRKKEKEEGRGRKDKAPQAEGDSRAPTPLCRDPAEGPRLAPLRYLTPLTQPVSTILDHAEDMGIVEYPRECMKISPKADPNKYCRFHGKTVHDTDECMVLKL